MATAPAEDTRLPLFYRAPEPVSAETHAGWKLTEGDVDFASGTPFVPLSVSEFAEASRSYPIVFAAGDGTPLALLGLDWSNRFVQHGHWAEDHYVPAYVRRYPFCFMAAAERNEMVLAIDAESALIVREGDGGVPLFDDDQPSDALRAALSFCAVFERDIQKTREFTAALHEQGLLIDRRADARLGDEQTLALHGFRIIDEQALAELADAIVIDWHRRGWLHLANLHLSSLGRFGDLLDRILKTAQARLR